MNVISQLLCIVILFYLSFFYHQEYSSWLLQKEDKDVFVSFNKKLLVNEKISERNSLPAVSYSVLPSPFIFDSGTSHKSFSSFVYSDADSDLSTNSSPTVRLENELTDLIATTTSGVNNESLEADQGSDRADLTGLEEGNSEGNAKETEDSELESEQQESEQEGDGQEESEQEESEQEESEQESEQEGNGQEDNGQDSEKEDNGQESEKENEQESSEQEGAEDSESKDEEDNMEKTTQPADPSSTFPSEQPTQQPVHTLSSSIQRKSTSSHQALQGKQKRRYHFTTQRRSMRRNRKKSKRKIRTDGYFVVHPSMNRKIDTTPALPQQTPTKPYSLILFTTADVSKVVINSLVYHRITIHIR